MQVNKLDQNFQFQLSDGLNKIDEESLYFKSLINFIGIAPKNVQLKIYAKSEMKMNFTQ